MSVFKHKSGRIWFQRQKFVSYDLLLPYGMTDVTDPKGAVSAVREPHPGNRGESVITDIIRAEADIPGFTIETRLHRTLNYLLGQKCAWNFQAHLGDCGRADDYFTSEMGLHWEECYKGDGAIDRLALIEGDNAPVAMTVPESSRYPFVVMDFGAEFLSARTIAETEAITDMWFFGAECYRVCKNQEDNGENGYAVTTALAGSPLNVANVWYTGDKAQSFAEVAAGVFRPFAGGEDISCVVVMGTLNNHRVIVSRGTADNTAPAEIAYADVTEFGTVTGWNNVNVGVVNDQYVTYMFWVDWNHLYAITNDGYVYKSTTGGVTWSTSLTTAAQQLNDISGLRDGTLWIVGNSGTVYLSLDHAISWDAQTDPSTAEANLTTCTATPDGTVYIGDNQGAIYGSYDNAANYALLVAQGITPSNIVRVRHSDDSGIWVIVDLEDGTGRALRSTDGGANFRLWALNLPTNSGLEALFVGDANLVYVGGQPHAGTAFITRTNPQVIGF